MSLQPVISKAQQLMEKVQGGDATGHDHHHVLRVRATAVELAKQEGADPEIVELAALLHDVWDHKMFDGDFSVAPQKVKEWLENQHVDPAVVNQVSQIVGEVSYKGAGVPTPMSTLEGKVVQDADRLDAIGAVGIARAFAFGGAKHRPLFDPSSVATMHDSPEAYTNDKGATINHFYEKLLLLKERMNTTTGKKMAEARHVYMEGFLAQFYQEWEGKA